MPAGQKFLRSWQAIARQSAEAAQDISRKASDEIKTRLTEALLPEGAQALGENRVQPEMASIRFPAIRPGLALFVMAVSAASGHSDASLPELVPVKHSQLCITEGALETLPDGRLSVGVAKLRAVLAAVGPQAIEARFIYLGPTAEMAPLRSGAMRQQFGLKLRAADGCNLVYVMWRFAPQPSLIVSVKNNPGVHASKACGTSGYRTVNPQRLTQVAAPQIGAAHSLAAAQDGAALHVLIDGRPAFDGELGPEALDIDGPVGIRSDNARLELTLFAPPQAGQGACPNAGGAEDE